MVRTLTLLGLLMGVGLLPLDADARRPRVDREAAAARPSDAAVSGSLVRELMLQAGVRSDEVDVRVRNGIAVLGGSVDNLLSKERAVEIAGNILGIRAVVDMIAVEPPDRVDAALIGGIRTAWAMDPATETYQMDAQVEGGAVVLTGTVESEAERRVAELLTKGVTGVHRVQNDIAVRKVDGRHDVEIRDDVRALLHWDLLVDGSAVAISVRDGLVTLTGSVATKEERERATELAWAEGARQVGNLLTVEPKGPARSIRYAPPVISDASVREAVEDALALDPRILSESVSVEVQRGVVHLSGIVESAAAAWAAAGSASLAVGVRGVEDALEVRAVRVAGTNE